MTGLYEVILMQRYVPYTNYFWLLALEKVHLWYVRCIVYAYIYNIYIPTYYNKRSFFVRKLRKKVILFLVLNYYLWRKFLLKKIGKVSLLQFEV